MLLLFLVLTYFNLFFYILCQSIILYCFETNTANEYQAVAFLGACIFKP
jgi:hypothetical protein